VHISDFIQDCLTEKDAGRVARIGIPNSINSNLPHFNFHWWEIE